eukprot:TRINITY_DN4224_c0_g1_i1.p1 TRINITY_DN4224_c0_g1~~TRINITY_DN4224_c0_g1_i1.p1  ORF type:complete len:80 (-),score=0.26 TRINITY_DN4224_c0_g1_i1:112-351(-)
MAKPTTHTKFQPLDKGVLLMLEGVEFTTITHITAQGAFIYRHPTNLRKKHIIQPSRGFGLLTYAKMCVFTLQPEIVKET